MSIATHCMAWDPFTLLNKWKLFETTPISAALLSRAKQIAQVACIVEDLKHLGA